MVQLLACALASYSRAWTPPSSNIPPPSPAARPDSAVTTDFMSETDDEAAEVYYEAARRRFGCLGMSLIDIQCFYYASLYERFAFRPLQAWTYLQQAGTRLRVHHMERNGRRQGSNLNDHDVQCAETRVSTLSYHFEQRAFWSIHKTERYVRSMAMVFQFLTFRAADYVTHNNLECLPRSSGLPLPATLLASNIRLPFPPLRKP